MSAGIRVCISCDRLSCIIHTCAYSCACRHVQASVVVSATGCVNLCLVVAACMCYLCVHV